MKPRLSLSSLKDGRWYEYLVRFVLGGLATVLAGMIGAGFGPTIGGIFLALPAIFCASATLIEKHQIRRKREAGLEGSRRGQEAAAVDAVGAALGSFGMIAFAICFALVVNENAGLAFIVAFVAWCVVAPAAWALWLRARQRNRCRRITKAPARVHTPVRG